MRLKKSKRYSGKVKEKLYIRRVKSNNRQAPTHKDHKLRARRRLVSES